LDDRNFEAAVTLNMNCLEEPTTEQSARRAKRAFGQFLLRLDKRVMKGDPTKRPPAERTRAVAIMEIQGGKIHMHAFLHFPPAPKLSIVKLMDAGRECWEETVPGGQFHYRDLTSAYGWGRYITKRIRLPEHFDHVFYSEEFHPQERAKDSFDAWLDDHVMTPSGRVDLKRLKTLAANYGLDASRFSNLKPAEQRKQIGLRLRHLVPEALYRS